MAKARIGNMSLGIFLATLLFTFAPPSVRATDLDDFNRIKTENARKLSECVDLTAQSPAQRQLSATYGSSLDGYLRGHITDEDRKLAIHGTLVGVGTDATHTVFIFGVWNPLAAQPGEAMRAEHRHRLQHFINLWRELSPTTEYLKYSVRFSDECDVPNLRWY